jgi:hypothetical protein
MRRSQILLIVALIATGPALSACADFDLDKLDVFGLNEKKKLPGERKQLFPEGVPGVQQGVPKEYMQGYQEQQRKDEEARLAAQKAEEEAAAEKAKQAALEAERRQERRKAMLKNKPTSLTVGRPQQQQQQPQDQQPQQPQAQTPWPQQQPSR